MPPSAAPVVVGLGRRLMVAISAIFGMKVTIRSIDGMKATIR